MIFFCECATQIEQIENIPRNRHYLRDRSNSFEHLEDHEFQARFRFSKDTVRSIFDMISDDLITFSRNTLANVYVDLLVFTRIAGTS